MGAASSRCVACLIGEGANVRLAKTQSAGKHSAVGVTFLVNVSPAWDTDSTTGVATACAVGVDGLDGDLARKADLSTSSCHTASNALEILQTRLPLREPHFLKAKGELGGCVMYLLFRYTGLSVGVIRPQSRSTGYLGTRKRCLYGVVGSAGISSARLPHAYPYWQLPRCQHQRYPHQRTLYGRVVVPVMLLNIVEYEHQTGLTLVKTHARAYSEYILKV